ncbi:MAG TPA: hypothetical protein VL383_13535 [Gemmatimonadaceae bacterium]|jgi:hypothetical protein|nr:hypothetical protein [Gemmatimonadaceae bacterium]
MQSSVRTLTAVVIAAAASAGAQTPIPIRTIGPILASSTENVGRAITVRATSDGHVIVGAGARQRVYAFDSTLKTFTIVVDSGTGTGIVPIRTTGVIPYLGDSTLLPDFGANALLVLDATGKQVRSMAPPRAQDLVFLGIPAAFGRPGFDAKGRLIYRTQLPPNLRPKPTPSGDQKIEMTPVNPDSAPIVRGDFDTRRIDTLAWMKTPSQGRVAMEVKENPAGGPPSMTMHMMVNPFPMSDEWSLLSDGTIAIVRVHDYHIDWIDPDGSRRSSPKMPIDWRRYTDEERTQRVDSIKRVVDEQLKRQTSMMGPGGPQIKMDVTVVPDSEFPSFWPPIQPGSVLSDLDGRLWILPATSTHAANGLTYDVVNRSGELVERVQLPKDRVIAGFGPHNVLYLTRAEGDATYLERALLSGPPK